MEIMLKLGGVNKLNACKLGLDELRSLMFLALEMVVSPPEIASIRHIQNAVSPMAVVLAMAFSNVVSAIEAKVSAPLPFERLARSGLFQFGVVAEVN